MRPYWKNTDPDERLTQRNDVLSLQDVTFAEAQEQVNFVVFKPAWLPSDCTVRDVTIRPEQPPGRPNVEAEELGQTPWSEANPCSLRAIIEGDGRRLRIKEFLYDWAPPAASVAPLWNSPELTPVPCQDTVAWLGTDYKENDGACVQLQRSQIEISVEAGSFTSDETVQILRSLAPANPEAGEAVRQARFHDLNYWVRYRLPGVGVPYGLWDYSEMRHYEWSERTTLPELREQSPVPLLMPAGDEFVFDSAVVITDESTNHREVEMLYRDAEHHNQHLWMVAMNAGSDLALPLPPEPTSNQAETRARINLRGTDVWYAALREERGAREAWWEEGSTRYAIWAGTSQMLNGKGFRSIVRNLRHQV